MDLGFFEVLTLAVLALVVFGPRRLPEAARSFGAAIAKFRREANATLEEFRRSADLAELAELRNLRDELRATRATFKPTSLLTGPMAPPYSPRKPFLRSDPPPFDTDAT